MDLKQQEIILLDFQTTGTAAAASSIVEAGWGIYRATEDPESALWNLRLIALPDEAELSRTIQRLTGLSADYYRHNESLSPAELKERLAVFLEEHRGLAVVVHFAQFKLPFLWKALDLDAEQPLRQAIEMRVVCLHKLSRRLWPQLKSFSLRAVAGYAGYATAEKKRSRDHLLATAFIWRQTVEQIGDTPEWDTDRWMESIRSSKGEESQTLALHDAALRKKRLALPHSPGVYYFLDRFGNILYVGKAADLKHRVNSYFRGRKTKGSRLNEMLTRAVDFRFALVTSELAALLMENDEIKRIDPPYNRMLRAEGRSVHGLRFRDIWPDAGIWGSRVWGPLSSLWMSEILVPMLFADENTVFPSYMKGVTTELIQVAISRLFISHSLEREFTPHAEDWHRLAQTVGALEYQRLLERQEKYFLEIPIEEIEEPDAADEEEELAEPDEEAKEWTSEDIENFMRQSIAQLIRQLYRARWLLRLAHCEIHWQFVHQPGVEHHFDLRLGQLQPDPMESRSEASYAQRLACFDRPTYDRISILYSELRKGIRRGDRIHLQLSSRTHLDELALRRYLIF